MRRDALCDDHHRLTKVRRVIDYKLAPSKYAGQHPDMVGCVQGFLLHGAVSERDVRRTSSKSSEWIGVGVLRILRLCGEGEAAKPELAAAVGEDASNTGEGARISDRRC